MRIVMALALALGSMGNVAMAQDGAAQAKSDSDDLDKALALMMAGRSQVEGEALEKKLKEASAFPFGSKENPVRAQGPAGQRAYLARLRCENLKRPEFYRAGSAGVSPYGNIVDVYVVTCEGSAPAKRDIYIDMYHRGHIEDAAVPGFGIVGGRAQ